MKFFGGCGSAPREGFGTAEAGGTIGHAAVGEFKACFQLARLVLDPIGMNDLWSWPDQDIVAELLAEALLAASGAAAYFLRRRFIRQTETLQKNPLPRLVNAYYDTR